MNKKAVKLMFANMFVSSANYSLCTLIRKIILFPPLTLWKVSYDKYFFIRIFSLVSVDILHSSLKNNLRLRLRSPISFESILSPVSKGVALLIRQNLIMNKNISSFNKLNPKICNKCHI